MIPHGTLVMYGNHLGIVVTGGIVFKAINEYMRELDGAPRVARVISTNFDGSEKTNYVTSWSYDNWESLEASWKPIPIKEVEGAK